MKKHLFNKCLLTGVAMFATLTCLSCQQRSTTPAHPKEPLSRPLTPSSQFNCDESEEGCNVEEAGEEAMIHVIEIDQPETTNVSEEKSSMLPVLEAPTEVSAAPAEAPVATPAETTASETVSAPSATESTATIAVQEAEASSPEQKQEPKKEQD